MIQYQEQGTFIDYIGEAELMPTLRKRYVEAERLYAYGTAQEIAAFLIVYLGTHTRESLLPVLEDRLSNLQTRITKLETKRRQS